jgi:hypothetical protein
MSAEGGYREILTAMEVGTYSKVLFDPVNADITKCLLRERIISSSRVNKKSYIDQVSMMDPQLKKKIIKSLENKWKFSYPNASYSPALIEVEGYDVKPINVPSNTLRTKTSTEFSINLSYNDNYNFVGSQFIRCIFKVPKLADPTQVPIGYVPKFWYTGRPGIRLLQNISALSDTAEFDKYTQNDVLKFETDSLPDNIWEIWNKLIGQDLGVDSSAYNPSTEANEIHRIKIGYQTAKSDPDKLVVYIPLLFSHNRNLNDKINLAIFNKNTISFKGNFAPSNYMVRAAAFNPDSVESPPILLDVAPLEFESCDLYSLLSAVDDKMYAMNLGLFYNKLYNYIKHERYEITESKSESLILRGRGEVLQMAIAARPSSYAADFDKWQELSPVVTSCYPVPIAVADPANPGSFKISIVGSQVDKQVSPFKHINLMYNSIPMLVDGTKDGSGDPKIWELIDTFSKSYRYLDYQVRKTGLIYFNFNPHVNTKRIAALYNMSKLDRNYLKYTTSDVVPTNPNGSLVSPYEVLVFRDIMNDHVMSGDSLVKVSIN